MRHTSFLSSLAVAAVLASPVAAQQSLVSERVRPATDATTPDDRRSPARTLVTYDFSSSFDGMPSRVTVADSNGTLIASFRPRGAPKDRPMKVAVADRDILLEGETVRGTLTIVLYEQTDTTSAGTLLGTWALGSYQGELRARAVR